MLQPIECPVCKNIPKVIRVLAKTVFDSMSNEEWVAYTSWDTSCPLW